MNQDYGQSAVLMLADGTKFYGKAIGYQGIASGEICFNTGMTGYQEIFTDPSYVGQIVVMTNVHIGNYGTKIDENQSGSVKVSGIVVRNFSSTFSRLKGDASLQEFLEKNKIVGIANLDTRALVRYIRNRGAMNVVIAPADTEEAELKRILTETPDMEGCELSSGVTVIEPEERVAENQRYRVAVIDYGCKENIYQNLVKRGMTLKIFPADVDFDTINDWHPDAFFLSNGPGDPAAMDYAMDTVRQIIRADKPVFGICLGHQLLSLAVGIKTEKLKYGHRGINHPVLNTESGLGEITSQNHGFGIREETIASADEEIIITHRNLNDQSVEGIRWAHKPIFSVQYHPEASPGPWDSRYLFDQFLGNISKAATIATEVNV